MCALALLMEMGPHKNREKLWPEWELNPRPSGKITAALPTERQSQTGAGRGNWRCQFYGNEYEQVQEGLRSCKRWPCSTLYFIELTIVG